LAVKASNKNNSSSAGIMSLFPAFSENLKTLLYCSRRQHLLYSCIALIIRIEELFVRLMCAGIKSSIPKALRENVQTWRTVIIHSKRITITQ
jgi:hypothetical protein